MIFLDEEKCNCRQNYQDKTGRYNAIAAQWESNVYFMIKKWNLKWRKHNKLFWMIIKAIKTYNSKFTAKYEDIIYIINNSRINKTEKIIKLIKEKKIDLIHNSSLFTRS